MLSPKKIKSAVAGTKTPVYLYDRDCIKNSYYSLKKNLPSDIEIFYAVKANPHKDITAFLGRLGAGADVASAGELRIALKSGVRPDKISFAGPGKTKEELKYAVNINIASISVESDAETLIVNELSGKMKRVTNVAVRVNPAFGSQQAGLRMGGGSQQFGIDEERVPETLKTIKACRNLFFTGIHMHTGSQILSEETFVENMRYLLEFCIKLQAASAADIKWINFGGGLGIPYYKGQRALDIGNLGRLIKKAFDKTKAKSYLKHARYIIEPGRYLVGEAGVYITKVLYKKRSRGKTFLIVDGGMHQNLAAAGLLGEGLRRNRIFGAITTKHTKQTEVVTVAGCLCTPLDILARDLTLPKCEPEDYLYITCSGAYGCSASPVNFLSHPSPIEVVI
jgi:diaminopimelate decarboxylase